MRLRQAFKVYGRELYGVNLNKRTMVKEEDVGFINSKGLYVYQTFNYYAGESVTHYDCIPNPRFAKALTVINKHIRLR